MWGGRFTSGTSTSLRNLNDSLYVDKRLYREDIKGSKVYAEALLDAGILNKEEYLDIIKGLDQVLEEWNDPSGKAEADALSAGDEDIHSAVERRLTALIGKAAHKLHTGRSRNDQVVTDTRLWMLGAIKNLSDQLEHFIQTIRDRAHEDIDVLMPGYTHLQQAQIVRWSHFLLSYAWSFKDDLTRLDDSVSRLSLLPLGSGAIAGNPFPIDRDKMAENLGFCGVTPNSMYGVGNRDFVAEFLFNCALCSVHLSRLSEDLIIFSTSEFGYVSLSDSSSTGSSLMPQKRNPDGFELARGLSGTLLGDTFGFMATLKGLPSTYNKDLQCDKETIFKAYDRLMAVLVAVDEGVKGLKLNTKRLSSSLDANMLAADMAYYLTRRGVPFREGHHIAGQVVQKAEQLGVTLDKLVLKDLKKISDKFNEDIVKIWSREESVEQYSAVGGTSKSSVREQIDSLQKWLRERQAS